VVEIPLGVAALARTAIRANRVAIVLLIFGMVFAPLAVARPTNAERCVDAADRLTAAIDGQDRAGIETAATALINLPGCDDGVRRRLRRLASRTLTTMAVAVPSATATPDETLARLRVARRIGQVWETLLAMADIQSARRDYKAATQLYQAALNDMAERYPDETAAPAERYAFAWQRANETQMLAPDEIAPPKRDGMPGGLDVALESSGFARHYRIAAVPPDHFHDGLG